MLSLGIYKRSQSGQSHFTWTERELLLVISKFKFPYQGKFKRNGKYKKIGFIPHLNQLIRASIKETVIQQSLAQCGISSCRAILDGQFDKIASRWVRFPSCKAIESKIRDCFILSNCRDPTQRIFSVSKLHQDLWLKEMDRAADAADDDHVFKFGNCHTCGSGIDDKSDINYILPCWGMDAVDADTFNDHAIVVCTPCADSMRLITGEWELNGNNRL